MTDEQRKAWDEYVADLRADGWKVELTAAILAADAELKGLGKVARAAEELLEVSDLRGDIDDIPGPCDDPKLWTARLITAWEEIRAALDALKKIQS